MARLEVALGDIKTFAADYVANDDGPAWHSGTNGEPGLLFTSYYSAVQLAAQSGAKTVAIPSISTGSKGYPVEDAAEIAVAALLEALADFMMIDQVTIVTDNEHDCEVFTNAIDGIFD